jgi:hypothetical protein
MSKVSRLVDTRGDHFHRDTFSFAFVESNTLAATFIQFEKLRIAVVFQIFPCKHGVLAGIESAHAEVALLISGVLLIEVRTLAAIRTGNDDNGSIRNGVIRTVEHRALDGAPLCAERHIQGVGGATDREAGIGYVFSPEVY